MIDHVPGPLKHGIDAVALGATIGSLVKFLPAIAATLSIVWTLIRIYESATFQRALQLLRRAPRDDSPAA